MHVMGNWKIFSIYTILYMLHVADPENAMGSSPKLVPTRIRKRKGEHPKHEQIILNILLIYIIMSLILSKERRELNSVSDK